MSDPSAIPANLGDALDSDQRVGLGEIDDDVEIVGETDPEGIADYDATTDDDDPDAIDITESDGPDLEAGDDLS